MTNTIKNIILCIATLLFVNWLLNIAKVNELERKIKQLEMSNDSIEHKTDTITYR